MKRWKNIAGSAFALLVMASVLFLYGGDLRDVDFTNADLLPGLAGATGLYVIVILTGAFGWRVILTAFGSPPVRWVAERQVLIPQIGKYLPGNFAHYLARAAMTASAGVPPATIGIALAAEVAATVAGGMLAIVVAFALAPELTTSIRDALPAAPDFTSPVILVVILALLLCAALAHRALRLLKHMPRVRPAGLLAAVALYGISFLLLGLSMRLIANSLSPAEVPLSLSVALFAAAWISGLVTPGAPGGLGVRESVLTLGLAPILGGATALAAALLHRGVSVLGDVISFGFGLLLPQPERTEPDLSATDAKRR